MHLVIAAMEAPFEDVNEGVGKKWPVENLSMWLWNVDTDLMAHNQSIMMSYWSVYCGRNSSCPWIFATVLWGKLM